jgi:hypothetical protein
LRSPLKQFFRHLAILFRARQSITTGQPKRSFWKFFTYALSRPKPKSFDRTKLELKWFQSAPKPPRSQQNSFLHFLRLALSSSKPKTLPKDKTPSPFLHALKSGPSLQLSDTKSSLRRMWKYILVVFSRRHSKPDDASKGPSFAARTWMLLRQDFTTFASQLDPLVILKSAVKIIAGIVIFIIGFEFFLQLTTLFAWSMLETKPKVGVATQQVILFAGDSYTSGRFVSYKVKPYVDFIEERVRRGEIKKKILKFSSEFLTAKDLEQELPALLYKFRPELVYVMIGVNDLVANSAPVETLTTTPLPESREVELFRTPMLLREWNHNRSMDSVIETVLSPPPFLEKYSVEENSKLPFSESKISGLMDGSEGRKFPYGNWHLNGTPVRFTEEGEMIFPSKKVNYSIRGNAFIEQNEDMQTFFVWEANGEYLTLSGPNLYDIRELTKKYYKNVPQVDLSSTWWKLEMGALDSAEVEFRVALRKNPEDVIAHAGLCETLSRLGFHDQAKKEIAWLQTRYQRNPGIKAARALLHSFPFENSIHETAGLTVQLLSAFPEDPWLWGSVAVALFQSSRQDLANAAMNHALKLTPEAMIQTRASFLRKWATNLADFSSEASLKHNIQAFLMDNDEQLFIESIHRNVSKYLNANNKRILDDLSCPSDKRRTVELLLNESLNENFPRRVELYTARLKNIIAICKEYGATPVFLTYPVSQPEIDVIIQRVAQESDAGWLNIGARFEILLKTKNQKQEIMKYGQLTEEAHRNIADWIATDISDRAIRR